MPRRKPKTREQVERMRQKAVRFLRDVVGDPERAGEFAAMSTEEYAARKRIEIATNPAWQKERNIIMAAKQPSRAELEERVEELEEQVEDLEDENQDLHDKLDSIIDIAEEEEEGEGKEADDLD